MVNHSHIIPVKIGVIHFVGIGGIGMSGIAEILHDLGYQVQGSDMTESYITDRLKSKGITIFIGHNASNLTNASLLVKSTAVKDDNIEIITANRLLLPVIKRSEMLAEIMRFKHSIAISGTHGKTTTTSLIAKMLEEANLSPTVINGGVINELGTNARLGAGRFLVVEADESDGTFIHIPAFVAIITNINPEHLDYYGDFDNAKDAYFQFLENLPFYGFGVLCFDHEEVRNLATRVTNRLVISYALDFQDADLLAYNIKEEVWGYTYDVKISSHLQRHLKIDFDRIEGIKLSMMGEHNIQNSLASIAVALKLGIDKRCIQSALATFKGVKRRFTKVAEIDQVTIIDDYAHHPVEIKTVLKMARKISNRNNSKVIAIVQPHRYSRLKDLSTEFSQCFKDADILYISDIYSAGEAPIEGVTAARLVENIKMMTNQEVYLLPSYEEIPQIITGIMNPHDLVIFMGAGSVTKWAYMLPEQIKTLAHKSQVA